MSYLHLGYSSQALGAFNRAILGDLFHVFPFEANPVSVTNKFVFVVCARSADSLEIQFL